MKNRIELVIIFAICIGVLIQAQQLRINEIVSSNSNGLVDEDGDYPDWIELFNAGPDTLDLVGAGLSDDPGMPFKWVFPELIFPPDHYLVIFASGKDRTTPVTHWETVVDWGDNWSFFYNNGEPDGDWVNPGFDDGTWETGPSGFGYGDGDDATILDPTLSAYLRINFSLPFLSEIQTAMLHIDYDDGFVAYLNGSEIARANIGTPGIPPNHDQGSDTWREAQLYQGGSATTFSMTGTELNLLTTNNTLAIQVHNYNIGSSDLSLIPFFSVGYASIPTDSSYVNELLELPTGALHTNFRISSSGEELLLSAATGQIIDSLTIPALPADMSWGRNADSPATWMLFPYPTPGNENGNNGYLGFASVPEFSQEAGFFQGSISLGLTATGQSPEIYYTTDGSDPAIDGQLYINQLNLSSTIVVRAETRQSGFLPSGTVTNTYFIDETTTLPVVSLSTDPANFWDSDSGIYVMGPNADPVYPYFGANFWQDWERPVHLEFFEPGATTSLDMDVGVKIFGQWSRAFPQRSLAIFARSQYGNSNFDYPLFPELPEFQYEAFVLRNSGNDWGVTMLRDALMTGLVDDLDMEHQAYRPVVVFLNGEYWGIHNLREKVNEHFIAAHHNLDADEIDILENNAQVVQGSADHYTNLLNFIQSNDITLSTVYTQVQDLINIDNYIAYQVSQIYFDNTDWPGNNIKLWRPQTVSGQWRWILYDTDFGFGLFNQYAYNNNTLEFALDPAGPDWPNPPWSTYLLRRLLENSVFRQKFILMACDLLNSQFAVGNVFNRIQLLHDGISSEIPAHTARWGSSLSQWENNLNVLDDFALYRPAHFRMHLRDYFNLSDPVVVRLNTYPAGSGRIQINTLPIDEFPWNGAYFPDLPVTVTAVPNPGYRFTGWSPIITSTNSTISFIPGSHDMLTAMFVPDSTFQSIVVINEINYNSPASAEADDWIELYNHSGQDLDLSNWTFKDSEDNHVLNLPSGTQLLDNDFLVICADSNQFRSIHSESIPIVGNFNFGLSGAGELIRLFDQTGNLIDSLTYDDEHPWPTAADGNGPTLELINPGNDNSYASNWSVSFGFGSPGLINDSYLYTAQSDLTLVPEQLKLYQNYPNPFNHTTVINFDLPKANELSLVIFDISGRQVASLLSGYQSRGVKQVTWSGLNDNGQSLSSGVYLYRLQVNKRVQTRKLILIK